MDFSRKEIFKTLDDLNYKKFTKGKYNLNIVAVRNDNKISGFWDDEVYVIFKDNNNEWKTIIYSQVTTDPGRVELQSPSFPNAKVNGTAIIKEGQYPGAYTLGFHRNKSHPALQQTGKISIYRDRNRDEILDYDPETVTEGWYGCNIHTTRPNWRGDRVYNWSAGCIVFEDWFTFQRGFIELCRRSAAIYGDKFTLTLLTESQILESNNKNKNV